MRPVSTGWPWRRRGKSPSHDRVDVDFLLVVGRGAVRFPESARLTPKAAHRRLERVCGGAAGSCMCAWTSFFPGASEGIGVRLGLHELHGRLRIGGRRSFNEQIMPATNKTKVTAASRPIFFFIVSLLVQVKGCEERCASVKTISEWRLRVNGAGWTGGFGAFRRRRFRPVFGTRTRNPGAAGCDGNAPVPAPI